MSINILVVMPVEEKHKITLESKAPSARFTYVKRGELTAELVQKANVIIGNPPVNMIKESKNLKWLQLNSAGVGDYINEGFFIKIPFDQCIWSLWTGYFGIYAGRFAWAL